MEISNHKWDAIVVGTGPSGAAIAKELTVRGKRVLILEKGKTDFTLNIPSMLNRKEFMFIGKGRTLARGIRTGGSSVLYYGTAYDPPPGFFGKYGIDLSRELEELKRELPIGPLPDEKIGPAARTIMESAKVLGLPWKKLNKFVEEGSGTQWNATAYVREAVVLGATLVEGADVRQVVLDGKKAIGVQFKVGKQLQTAFGENIVLAAGGIASPQILQNSGIHGAGDGFFCDPLIIVQGAAHGIHSGQEIPMAAGMASDQEGYILTDITLPKIVYQLFAAQALRFHRMAQHEKSLSIMVKIKDSIAGRIREGKVTKSFTEEDKRKMHAGWIKAKKILEHAGARHIYRSAWTSAHPGGSARLGEIVDSHLQTEYSGLFVCDCSVIPEEWGLPPTLTLLALGKRLGKQLR